MLVLLYAVAMLATDPRVAIAGAVPLTALGLGVNGAVVLLPAAPLVLVVAALSVGRHGRRTVA